MYIKKYIFRRILTFSLKQETIETWTELALKINSKIDAGKGIPYPLDLCTHMLLEAAIVKSGLSLAGSSSSSLFYNCPLLLVSVSHDLVSFSSLIDFIS